MTTKPQAAQLKRYTVDRGILREVKDGEYGAFVHYEAIAEAAERIATLEGQIREMVEKAAANKLDGYRELAQRLNVAEQQRDAAVRDAERYRWLQSTMNTDCAYLSLEDIAWHKLRNGTPEELSAAIDAARSGERGEGSNG